MPVAIVTGASRGLGLAIARGLAAYQWQLVIDARGAEALNAVAEVLPGKVVALPGDITDPAHRAALVAAADRLGGADLVVNNAGTLGPSPLPRLADYPLDGLRAVLEATVIGPLGIIQWVLPGLRERGGSVVNITSDAALEAYEGWGGYGAAKAAIEQASRVLAAEEPTVRVWWVDPGDLRTQMHQEAFPGEDIGDRPLPETVVPAFLHLVRTRPESGRVKLADVAVPA